MMAENIHQGDLISLLLQEKSNLKDQVGMGMYRETFIRYQHSEFVSVCGHRAQQAYLTFMEILTTGAGYSDMLQMEIQLLDYLIERVQNWRLDCWITS